MVSEKAWVQGIAVVETEESNTSRTSFVHGDPMEVHPAQAAKAAKKKAKSSKGKASAKAKSKAPRAFLRSPGKSPPLGAEAMKASFQKTVEHELAKQAALNQQPKTAASQASGARGKPIAGPPSKTHAERKALWLSKARGTPEKWTEDRAVDGKGLGGTHADLNAAYNIGRKACPCSPSTTASPWPSACGSTCGGGTPRAGVPST